VPPVVLVVLAAAALALDGVDGRVARRTGTVSAVGGRFDVEVDSFLVLVLGVVVAHEYGPWVLAIGSPHYVLVLARRALPWLRREMPPRHWCKVVAVVQAVVLLAVASGVLPPVVAVAALVVVAALLAESFGREIRWAWRHRDGRALPAGSRPVVAAVATALAVLLVWAALVFPDRLVRLTPLTFARIPVEGLVLVALALALPPRARRRFGVGAGLLLGVLAIVRILDMGFREFVHRPFNPVTDWRLLDSAVIVLRDSVGQGWADVALVGGVLLVVGLVAAVAASTARLIRVAARRRALSAGTVGSLGALWVVCAVLGVYVVPGAPVASLGAAQLAAAQVVGAYDNLRDLPAFRAQLAADDPWSRVPGEDLLTALRGKDVVIAFVESYGRVAVEGAPFSADIRDLLSAGTQATARAGFGSRSAFLTSPTFGGVSWLAHATLHSGLWIDSQQRHDQLLESDRFTLSAAFARAGWRTVADVPSNRDPWPEGEAFYRFDRIYDRHDVGYAGPKFSFAAMPDQYTLAAFDDLELGPGHDPVMAEIDLVSSHEPWTPLPRMVPWDQVGDGTVYRGMPDEGPTPAEVFGDAERIQRLYGQSIEYSLTALISWVTTFHGGDDDLVLILVGDHQPAEVVSGPDASHDVPITVLTRDPAVLDRIAGWGWDDGMLPGRHAPVWRMDAFRDRFLAAFGPATPAEAAATRPRGG
jgi:phosphatidylglycerophosphate synthase